MDDYYVVDEADKNLNDVKHDLAREIASKVGRHEF